MDKYQIAASNGESISVPVDGEGIGYEKLTAAQTLTYDQSGKTLVLNAATGAALVLPALGVWKYKFVVGLAFATTSWTITAPSAVINGTVIVNGASVLGESEDTITFVNSAEKVGDFVEVECDGTLIYVSGVGSAAGSITLTAS